jgi:hypothetical protein
MRDLVPSRRGRRRASGVTFVLCICAAAPVRAQRPLPPGAPIPPSVLPSRPWCDDNTGLDAGTFEGIINQRFSALVSPASEGIPGTFLGLEIKEAQATATQTFVAASGRAWTLSARGGVNDGVVAIVNDATLTPKFGATVQFHALGRGMRALRYTATSCDSLKATVRKAEATHASRVAEIRAHAVNVQYRIDTTALAAKLAKINAELAKRHPDSMKTASDRLTRDSLVLDSARIAVQRIWRDSIPRHDETTELLAVTNDRNKAYQAAAKLVDVRGFSIAWWSFGLSFDNVTYNLFDPVAALDAQISKGTHLTKTLSVTYSRLTQSEGDYESRYLGISARAGWENNLADLMKVEITDRTQFGAPPAERISEKKTTAYQGAFNGDVETLRLSLDYYQFVAKNDRVAVHLFPAFLAKNGQTGEVAAGIGVLLSSRDATKKTASLNAELFFNVPDLGNVRDSDKGPWKRGVLGLRLTFPINFSNRS